MTTTAIIPGSLQAIATRDDQALAETFVSADAVVIIDVSISMTEADARGRRTRYAVACEELTTLQAKHPGRVAVIAFSDDASFCPGGLPPPPNGCTDLAGALRFAHVCDGTGQKLALISDGEPDDEDDALAVARRYTSPIECIYVGPEGGGGRAFLQKLARLTGGGYQQNKVDDLAKNVETLLLTTRSTL